MEYRFTTRLSEMNLPQIHSVLSNSYWSNGIPFEVLEKALGNSSCFGLVKQGGQQGVHQAQQLAFGRWVTDKATFAYLADVYVLEAYQGQGLATEMLEQAMAAAQVAGLRRIMLATRDAHGLYKKLGFSGLNHAQAETFMQKFQPDIYTGE